MNRRRVVSMLLILFPVGLGILAIGLLPVGLLRMREAEAKRSRSMNNLKMIVLAVHNYYDAYQGRLPPLLDVGENAPTGAGLQSLFFVIQPYLDSDNLYRRFDKADPASYYRPSTGAAQTIYRPYISPADDTASDGLVTSIAVTLPARPPAPFARSFTGWYATTSYAANGMIPWGKPNFPRSVPDGTENTIMLGERPQACTTADGTVVYNLWGYGTYGPSAPAFALLTPDVEAGFPSTGQIEAAVPLPSSWSADRVPVRIGRETAPAGPSPVQRSFQVGVRSRGSCDPRLAGSPHLHGMIVALADGSVRTLSSEMSDWTYWAAMTPDGKETLHTDW